MPTNRRFRRLACVAVAVLAAGVIAAPGRQRPSPTGPPSQTPRPRRYRGPPRPESPPTPATRPRAPAGAPGPDADGNLALWARERATGQLHAYALPKQADGSFDFTARDHAAGVVASGFTTGEYPTPGSSGDLTGDGAPDLWAVTAGRHLVTYSGWTAPKDLGALR